MVKLKLAIELNYDVVDPSGDFIFNIHPAHTLSQTVIAENLVLNQPVSTELICSKTTGNRYLRLKANKGHLKLNFTSTLKIKHHFAPTDTLMEVPVSQLPAEALNYLYPSRYCQSDRLHNLAVREFGALEKGYGRVKKIAEWVHNHLLFLPNSSTPLTSAVDSLVDQAGVCRDFAHLMIALCRAVNIPARFTTGIDFGADPALGAPDFHAYVEVFVGDGWYIFDPSQTAIPMGFIRLGTGYDASHVAFATFFGSIHSFAPQINIEAVVDSENGYVLPYLCEQAISTDFSTRLSLH